MDTLRELYQEVILDHNRNPRNYHAMADATRSVEGYNPLCGDHYTVYVRMKGDVIDAVSFEGAGCAISKASASVMSSVLRGKSRAEAEEIFRRFHTLVTEGVHGDTDLEQLGRLAAFGGVSEFPARVKCASLAWHTLHAALDSEESQVTTE